MKIDIKSSDNDIIKISILGRTFPDEKDRWDANWLNATIEIKAGKFSGKTNVLLRSEELLQFSNDLKSLFENKRNCISFLPTEPWINLEIKQEKLGNLNLSGQVTDRLGTGNILQFSFLSSQQSLVKLIEDIEEITKEFPVMQ